MKTFLSSVSMAVLALCLTAQVSHGMMPNEIEVESQKLSVLSHDPWRNDVGEYLNLSTLRELRFHCVGHASLYWRLYQNAIYIADALFLYESHNDQSRSSIHFLREAEVSILRERYTPIISEAVLVHDCTSRLFDENQPVPVPLVKVLIAQTLKKESDYIDYKKTQKDICAIINRLLKIKDKDLKFFYNPLDKDERRQNGLVDMFDFAHATKEWD